MYSVNFDHVKDEEVSSKKSETGIGITLAQTRLFNQVGEL